MPLAVRRGGGGGGGVQQKALVTQLLADHSTEELRREEVKQEIEPRIDQSDLWLVKYDELALKTHNIPLSHLSCCCSSDLQEVQSPLPGPPCPWIRDGQVPGQPGRHRTVCLCQRTSGDQMGPEVL